MALFGDRTPYDPRARFRTNSLALVVVFGVLACVILGTTFWVMGARWQSAAMLVGLACILGVVMRQRRTADAARSLVWLLGVFFTLIVFYGYCLGGVRSAASWWFIVPPAVLITCSMQRAMLSWCVACGTALAALYALERAGHSFPLMPGAGLPELHFISLLLLSALLLGFLGLLGRSRDRSMEALENTVAEVREAHDVALAAARAKSEFLTNMSHEIRTPINGVIGMAELLGRTPLAEQQSRYLSSLRQSGEHLLRLVNDVFDYAELAGVDGRSVALDEEPFSPREVLAQLVDAMTGSATAKGLALVTVVADEVPARVVGDAPRVLQILCKLVANAIKFTCTGRVCVTVRCASAWRDDAPMLEFEVLDTGIGIDEPSLQRLGVAFAQADSSSTRVFGGLGLGLAISQALARLMQGGLHIESEIGVGTRVVCTLAFGAAPPTSVSESQSAAAVTDLTTAPAVLLVEDNPVNLELGVAMLEQLACEVTVAHDGAEALAQWRAGRFHLVLMDCQMPVMDGYAATREIRATESASATIPTPIVAVTANVLEEDRVACFAAGMNDFLAKPYTLAQLQDVIARHAVRPCAA